MDTVELLQKIEDHFFIRIPNSEAEKIYLIQDYYAAVARHLPPESALLLDYQLQIRTIIADHAGLDLSEVQPHKSITHDLGLD